jgi:hypothetical protein
MTLRHGHHSAFGCERHLSLPLELARAIDGSLELTCGDQKGGLARVAIDLVVRSKARGVNSSA